MQISRFLVICEIFTLEILLAQLLLAPIAEQDTHEQRHLTLARNEGMLLPSCRGSLENSSQTGHFSIHSVWLQ